MAVTTTRQRGRKVELISPIKYLGNQVAEIAISPPKLDHVIRWGGGQIAGSLALLAELSGVSEGALRQLEYPDVDEVLAAFMSILPAVIRNDIDRGTIPLASPAVDGAAPARAPLAAVPSIDEEDANTGFDAGTASRAS